MNHQRKVILFIATSLDGYIATKDESLEWLFKVEGEGDNGFSTFYDTVDTIIMGKKTYDWIIRQDLKEFPYKNKDCFVFTSSILEDTEDVKFINSPVSHLIEKLKRESGSNIWLVGGGGLLHTFIKEKLLDEMYLTIAPTILGEGIPLFIEGDDHLDLILKGQKRYNQFVELTYQVKK